MTREAGKLGYSMDAAWQWNRWDQESESKAARLLSPRPTAARASCLSGCLAACLARDLVENLHPLRADVTRKGKFEKKRKKKNCEKPKTL